MSENLKTKVIPQNCKFCTLYQIQCCVGRDLADDGICGKTGEPVPVYIRAKTAHDCEDFSPDPYKYISYLLYQIAYRDNEIEEYRKDIDVIRRATFRKPQKYVLRDHEEYMADMMYSNGLVSQYKEVGKKCKD